MVWLLARVCNKNAQIHIYLSMLKVSVFMYQTLNGWMSLKKTALCWKRRVLGQNDDKNEIYKYYLNTNLLKACLVSLKTNKK